MTESSEKQTIIDNTTQDDDPSGTILASNENTEEKQDESSILPESSPLSPDLSSNIGLRLGDIIEINSPSNKSLDKHIFVITYIDESEITIIDSTTLESKQLFITDGQLNDESIVDIALLSRDEKEGYARQNKLLPETWIDVYFGGDIPTVITGLITNLEEDMIEIKTYPENQVIYIDFGYKGIPKNLPIEKILIRSKPEELIERSRVEDLTKRQTEDAVRDETFKEKEVRLPVANEDEEEILESASMTQYDAPQEEVEKYIKETIIDADKIIFEEDLGEIEEIVEVSDEKQRFGIDSQKNDLLDELLSSIPNSERTKSVLNKIHTTIERFKQLRENFSTFDQHGNALIPVVKGANYKPLVEKLQRLNQKLYWILPVVKNSRKLYDTDINMEDGAEEFQESADIIPLTLAETRIAEEEIIDNYNSNDVPSEIGKYNYLNTELNTYMTPFGPPSYDNDVIIKKFVSENLDVVVDNLEDFYSSVMKNDIIKRQRFVIQKYNLASTRLQTEEISSSKLLVKRVPFTNSDNAHIRSFMTLPRSAVTFSHINLPGTNILQKSDLHHRFLNYWKFLRAKTSVTTQTVYDIEKPIEYTPESFMNSTDIKNYVLGESIDAEDTDILDEQQKDTEEIRYEKFLQAIIPKTRVMFDLVKRNIEGKLSLYDVISFLEPFMIYQDDLSYKQYVEIDKFISEKIKEHKKFFAYRSKSFQKLYNFYKKKQNMETNLDRVLSRSDNKDRIFDMYRNQDLSDKLSTSETLRIMMKSDFSKLYMIEMAKSDMDLQSMVNLQGEFEKAKQSFEQELDTEKKSNTCANYVLAKKYIAFDELSDDNDKPTYFDKKYDPTRYDILSEYSAEQLSMEKADFIIFLASELEKNIGLSSEDALYDAESMINGKRLVKDGQYALLDLPEPMSGSQGQGEGEGDDENDPSSFYYYRRADDQWVKDDSIDTSIFTEQSKLFCNIQEKCYNVKDDGKNICQDNAIASLEMKKQSMKDIITEFDDGYQISRAQLEKQLASEYNYSEETLDTLKLLSINKDSKYNNANFIYGTSLEEKEIVQSPHAKLRDLILGQTDFIKKQNDILLFTHRFTRPANDLVGEDTHFRYCTETNIKLLPTFMFTLAKVFVEKGDYEHELQVVCTEIGTISEDGDSWVDKHSGYVIKYIGFDAEEGYDESGFKVKTREVLEKDAASVFIEETEKKRATVTETSEKESTEERQMQSKDGQLISNVISTMSREMGVLLDSYKSYIISNVLNDLPQYIEDEETYEKKRINILNKKGKKIPEYEIAYSEFMLLLTLSYILISIQSMTPPPNTKKTFPGCVRSFSGYPMDGDGDMSALTYISCVAYKMKSSAKPWIAIKKSKEATVFKKLKKKLDKIIQKKAVSEKLKTAQIFLTTYEKDFIPVSHDIRKWGTFLPPLQNFTSENVSHIGSGYKETLTATIKSGSLSQYKDIEMLKGKIFYFSLAFIQKIQNIVGKKSTILKSGNDEPFLENACCSTNDYNVLRYFIDENRSLLEDNTKITELENMLLNIGNAGKASTIVYDIDTKMKYPVLQNQFSEEIIYTAFILYCKFNKNIIISEDLQRICVNNQSGFKSDDSLQDKINILKSEGRQFNDEALQQLLFIVGQKEIMDVAISGNVFDMDERLLDVVGEIETKDDEHIPGVLVQYIKNILETYENKMDKDTESMRDLKNYLARANDELQQEMIDFIKKNSGISRKKIKQITEFLQNINDWLPTGDNITQSVKDETNAKFVEFIRNSIYTISKVIPNIILNEVDYSSITIPRHWGLSERHVNDLKKIIESNYNSLKQFYGKEELIEVLGKLLPLVNELLVLIDELPILTTDSVNDSSEDSLTSESSSSKTRSKEKEFYRSLNRTITGPLYKQFFLLVLKMILVLKDDKDVKLIEKKASIPSQTVGATDETVTTEELESLAMGEISEIDVLEGKEYTRNSIVSEYLSAILLLLSEQKKIINYNSEVIMEKVLYSKEKEKEEITEYLKEMTDEERAVENIIKNSKLERWSKGLQKGLTQYVKDTYDEEREAIENRANMEAKVGKMSMVTDMNRDIFVLELGEQTDVDAEIEREEMDLTGLAEDDDYGDLDGDEQF